MKERLSETKVRQSRVPDGVSEVLLSDGDGLVLRVRRSRSDPARVVRQWLFRYKTGGKVNKVGLGGADAVSLAQARAKAEALRTRRDQGGTPTAATADSAIRTLADLFEHHEKVAHPAPGRREVWSRYVAAPLGRVRLEDVGRRHIVGLLDDIALAGRQNMMAGGRYDMRRTAGAVFGLLRQLMAFGVSRGLLGSDPMSGMKRREFGTQGRIRERVLSEAEITELSKRFALVLRVGPRGREFDTPAMHPAAQAAVWLLLATAARVGELAALRERDIDRKAKVWRIPATVAKNRREHIVHLSPFALKMIDALRKMPTKPPGETGRPSDIVYWGGNSLAKALHDRQREPDAKSREEGKRAVRDVLLLDGGPFTPHDLRRSAASLMQHLGVRSEVIERALNHTAPGIVKVYQRAEMLDERRAAFEALGKRLAELVDTAGIDHAMTLANRRAA